MLGPVLAQRCLDLVVLGQVEGNFAGLKRAGVSAGAWRARACMCGPISIPRSASPHAAASAQQHRRARLRAHFRLTWFLSFTSAPSLIRSATSSTMPFSAA
jgi:hypothetical protein